MAETVTEAKGFRNSALGKVLFKIATIAGLQEALNGKAASNHSHKSLVSDSQEEMSIELDGQGGNINVYAEDQNAKINITLGQDNLVLDGQALGDLGRVIAPNTTPTKNSTKFVTSGGVYNALNLLSTIIYTLADEVNFYKGSDISKNYLETMEADAPTLLRSNLPAGTYRFLAAQNGFPQQDILGASCLVIMKAGSPEPKTERDSYLASDATNVLAIVAWGETATIGEAADAYLAYIEPVYAEYIKTHEMSAEDANEQYQSSGTLSVSSIKIQIAESNQS